MKVNHSIRQIFIMTVLICFSVVCVRGDTDSLFRKANACYKAGYFKEAKRLYDSIDEKSATVNYNIGNCAYKLNDLGTALLHWRRAEQDWGLFGRRELLENISFINNTITKKRGARRYVSYLRTLVGSYARSFPIIFLQIIFLLMWFLFFMCLRIYKKRKWFIFATFIFLFVLVSVAMIVRYSFENGNRAVVMQKDVPLLSGPGNKFQALGYLHLGNEVSAGKESEDFVKIRTSGLIGWTLKKNVEKIKP